MAQIKNLACPHCNKKAMSLFAKALISPSRSYKCKHCSKFVKIRFGNSMLLMFSSIVAVKLLEIYIHSLLFSFFLVLPVALFAYAYSLPFYAGEDDQKDGISWRL